MSEDHGQRIPLSDFDYQINNGKLFINVDSIDAYFKKATDSYDVGAATCIAALEKTVGGAVGDLIFNAARLNEAGTIIQAVRSVFRLIKQEALFENIVKEESD